MSTKRLTAHAPRTTALARKIAALQSGCVGCKNCRGLCAELVELLSLPEAVLEPAEPK